MGKKKQYYGAFVIKFKVVMFSGDIFVVFIFWGNDKDV